MANRRWMLLFLLALMAVPASAQRWALATNVLDYANYGTLNAEGSMAVGRHWSATAVAKYNPFLYSRDGEPLSARQQLYGAGLRYWPWHVYSGWWAGTRLQYQEYNRGGIRDRATDEGDRVGLGISGGYSYIIKPHLNLEVGLGFWGGYDRYVTYSCPVCGFTEQSGERAFLLPNDWMLSLLYVF